MRILVLTDSNYHRERDTIFPVCRHLSELADEVWVADRADVQNAAFFHDCVPIDTLYMRRLPRGADYNIHTANMFEAEDVPLKAFESVWLRLEFPVSDSFLEYLPRAMPWAFVVNDPTSLIKTRSKLYLPELSGVLGDYIPKMAVCRNVDDVAALAAKCPQGIVLKQELNNGGKGVVRYRPGYESDLQNLDEVAAYLAEYGACLGMAYVTPPDGRQSDNRVLVMNGVLLGVVSRIPQDGSWICNLSSGGSAELIEATAREREVVRLVDPIMRREGIFLYGLDMLVGDDGERTLSEINCLNVGAVYVCEKLSGQPLTRYVAENLMAVFAAKTVDIAVAGALAA